MAKGMETYVPDLETVMIEGCGHWTQQEKPVELNRVMTGWLRKRFL
jgi:pimeloyl-ACP methyl ester carboxylesterase